MHAKRNLCLGIPLAALRISDQAVFWVAVVCGLVAFLAPWVGQ